MIATMGDATGRIVAGGSDEMGRWSWQQFMGRNGKTFMIISAYQVCEQEVCSNGRIKILTTTAQQVSMLRCQGRTKTPREAFICDLKIFIEKQKSEGIGILLVGDFNESLRISYDGMTKLISDFGFTDILWHGITEDNFGTHIGGSTRIDYIVADEWIANCVTQACYEPFGLRTKGDHRNK